MHCFDVVKSKEKFEQQSQLFLECRRGREEERERKKRKTFILCPAQKAFYSKRKKIE